MFRKLTILAMVLAMALPVMAMPDPGPGGSSGTSVVISAVATAQEAMSAFTPAQLKWQAAPPSLPPGAQIVVLEGNPAQAVPITMRLKFPAGYVIAPHYHPALEHVTVLSGRFFIAMGETLDKSKGTALGPGSFFVMPVGMRHYAWTTAETIIQLHSVGPWGITYVNPADDPRGSGSR
ncbi:MAG: cupin domain-containing protein [Armatimonadota bacterium]|nr:cupin domain-containing protein [Armatimonadota bacterium]MDR7499522.1 cupin domain-containing protein [Armatimonadota bacterium]